MSNSIWKTPDQKPDTDQHVLFFAGGGIFPYLGFYYPKFDTFNDWKSKDVQRWASVFETIAQADKAERLQKRWESLIQIKEKLDDYKHNLSVKTEQHERGYAYATKIIKDLESKLEIARKALEDMQHWLGVVRCSMVSHLNNQNNTLLEHYETDPTVKNIDKAKSVLKHYIEQIEHKEK